MKSEEVRFVWMFVFFDLPVGTKITMQNWEKYKAFMPFGMTVLFEGKYYWKMPADVEIDVGPVHNGIVPKTFMEMTEKYSAQNEVEALPNGHYRIKNFHGGVPFPDPQEPNKGTNCWLTCFSRMCRQ